MAMDTGTLKEEFEKQLTDANQKIAKAEAELVRLREYRTKLVGGLETIGLLDGTAEEAPAQEHIPSDRDVVVRNFAWGDSEKIISQLHPNLIKNRTDNGIYVVLDGISDLNDVACRLQLFLYEDQLFKIRFSRYGESSLSGGRIGFSTLGGGDDGEREYIRHRILNDLLEEKYDSPDERDYFTDKPGETNYQQLHPSVKFYSGYVCEKLIWNRPNTIIESYYLLGSTSKVPGKVTWRELAYEWKSEVSRIAISKAKKAAKEDAALKKDQQKSKL